jgi:hypothetical protein
MKKKFLLFLGQHSRSGWLQLVQLQLNLKAIAAVLFVEEKSAAETLVAGMEVAVE